jgi:hypothetical protein
MLSYRVTVKANARLSVHTHTVQSILPIEMTGYLYGGYYLFICSPAVPNELALAQMCVSIS